MVGLEELVQAAMAAPLEQREHALMVLQGHAQAVAPDAAVAPYEPYLTLREAAKRLGMSSATFWRWKVPGHQFGGRNRYKLTEIEAYLMSKEFKRRCATLRAIRNDQRVTSDRGGERGE